VDGGIRRGTDILKAIALGARAVMIGRPAIWGLTLKGAEGVKDVLEHLHIELVRAMQLAGVSKLEDSKPDLIAAKPSPEIR
jgi:4-hydroxymandelate oxidase